MRVCVKRERGTGRGRLGRWLGHGSGGRGGDVVGCAPAAEDPGGGECLGPAACGWGCRGVQVGMVVVAMGGER